MSPSLLIPETDECRSIAGHRGVHGADFSVSGDAVSQRFLDPEQAAVFLGGLNSRTVTRWAREGYLPAYPIGEGKRRLWRFLESDLERWMLSRRTGQGPSDSDAARRTLESAADAPIGGRFQ
jgi:excisionase family DNA binding protein